MKKALKVSFLGIIAAATSISAAPLKIDGLTKPADEVKLSAAAPGILTVQKVKEGDFVTAGTVLFELDKNLEELEVERRELVVEVKKVDFENTQKLFQNTKGVAKEEMEKKEREYRLAVVELKIAKEQLRRRIIIAPFSGVVTEILLDVGEACQAQTELAKMVDTQHCVFEAHIDPSLGPRFKVNEPVPLEFDAPEGTMKVTGKVDYCATVVDRASGLLRVKAVFENPEGKIRPGVAGKISLQ